MKPLRVAVAAAHLLLLLREASDRNLENDECSSSNNKDC